MPSNYAMQRRGSSRRLQALQAVHRGSGQQAARRLRAAADRGRLAAQMRLLFCAATLVSLALIPRIGNTQSMTTPATQYSEEQRVLAAEDEYVAAEVNRDEAALRRLVDDKFRYNTARGTTTGKEELIASLLKMNMVGQTIKERSVLMEGNLALVFGTTEIRFADPGKPESTSALRYTATYINRQGQWRMLALQMQQRAPQ